MASTITITIAGTPIELPISGASPDWSNGIIQAFQAIEGALNSAVAPSDVSPQTVTIDAANPGGPININNLSFSVSTVRSATVEYSVFRSTDTNTVYEYGTISIVYNPNNPIGFAWEQMRQFEGNAAIDFAISDTGQFSFTTQAIPGANHTGVISYRARALSQI